MNATDGGTWQTSLYRSRLGPASARNVATDTTFRAQDGYLVGIGFEYERVESAFLPMDAEMYWNEGAFTIATKNASVDGHAAAHRMYLQHLTSLSLVHGFSPLDGKSPGGGASPSPPHRPPNKLSRESIDVWQRTPLDLDFIDAWGLPIDAAHVESIAGIKNATCAEAIVSVAPSRRVLCDRPKARPLGAGNSTAQEKRCLSAGCCWDPVRGTRLDCWTQLCIFHCFVFGAVVVKTTETTTNFRSRLQALIPGVSCRVKMSPFVASC